VGKQAGFLKHVPQRAAVGRQEETVVFILPELAVHCEAAIWRSFQAGEAA